MKFDSDMNLIFPPLGSVFIPSTIFYSKSKYLCEQHNLQSKCAKEVKYTLQTFISCEFL
jgi:hypothetical protein